VRAGSALRLKDSWPKVTRYTWLSVATVVLLTVLWEAAIDLGWVQSAFIVSPSRIVRSAINLTKSGELTGHIGVTLARTFTGFLAGTLLGLIVGLAMGWSRTLRALLDPLVSIIYPLPKIALLPLIILMVGIGETPIILIVTLGAFFPVVVNSMTGVMNINQIYFEAAQNYGAGRLRTFTRVILPGSLPVAFSGIRLALGLSLLSTVIAELAIANRGLGAMLWLSWQTLRIDRIYVAIALIALIGLLLNGLLKLVSLWLIPWKEEK
jgi:ABC-type nitrate/sulfonate/bicarbonate transport system permease component